MTPIGELKQRLAARGNSNEVAMLIPSIDLMGGKIVQLVQGEKKALEFDDFEPWVERFSKYPLDPTDRSGCRHRVRTRQSELVRSLVRRLPCQVGGGIRTAETAQEILARGSPAGHHRIVADKRWEHHTSFAEASGGRGRRGEIGFCRGFEGRKSRNPGMAAAYRNFRRTNDPRPRALVRRVPLHQY